MKKIEELLKNKKVIIGVTVIVLIICGVGGYYVYDTNRKNTIRDKMTITFTDVKEIEYGIKDYNVKKELIKSVENADIKEISELDTFKVGEQTITILLANNDVEKTIDHKIKIVDTKAPIISLETENKDLIVNDEYDFKANIKEVKDEVDGTIELNKEALKINKTAAEEYNKIKKDDINEDTKLAEKSIDDFLIEDIEGKEEKNLYLKNCYYIDGNVDVTTVGEYTIKVVAVDKNGLKSEKDFKVTVKEKEAEPVTNNTGGNSGSSNYVNNGNSGGNSSSSNNSGGGSTPIAKQGISAVINSALGQVGTPYVWGGSAPGGFDCSGLIYWAFTSNGYSVPRAVNSAGYSIGSNLLDAQPGDIIAFPSHSALITNITKVDDKRYNFTVVTAYSGQGVTTTTMPIFSCNGTSCKFDGSKDWSDIRRVR